MAIQTQGAQLADEPKIPRVLGLRNVRANRKIKAYIQKANEQMAAIGYTEHGIRHAALVAAIARNTCISLGYDGRLPEIAAVAGYLHDIGNVVSRFYHPQIGASMSFTLLNEMGFEPDEIALIIGAIGNHEEPEGVPINKIAAAVILADKSDVHFTRVQAEDRAAFDIHDRVNFAVQKSRLEVDSEARTIALRLAIDIGVASVMEYFEIFVDRMVMCRKAAEILQCKFLLTINGLDL
jgi:metal-dependent HD superfamily phosphatase/phosphodiesterase